MSAWHDDAMRTPATTGPSSIRRRRKESIWPRSLIVFEVVLLAGILLRGPLASLIPAGGTDTWLTIFVAVTVQAIPFLVLGVLISGAIAAFVPASVLARLVPDSPAAAIPLAGIAGAALPGCECGSVPVADRLIRRGVRPSVAFAFLLSAPAINPVVLVATAVAFQADTRMAWARLAAGLVTAVVVGLVWEKLGRPQWLRPPVRSAPEQPGRGWRVFLAAVRADFVQAAGFLVIGAAAAATLNVIVPRAWMNHLGSSMLLSIALMALLAFVMALCSEADAFVAAALTTIPMVGKLVFLTVGPTVDAKLVAMQAGFFGRRFVIRFAPLTFAVATVVGAATGLVIWGGAV